jgi:hypothetical protein
MSKTPVTNEQKEWYLLGYIEASVQHLVNETKFDRKDIIKYLIQRLETNKS